jgi:hypothetical protein
MNTDEHGFLNGDGRDSQPYMGSNSDATNGGAIVVREIKPRRDFVVRRQSNGLIFPEILCQIQL